MLTDAQKLQSALNAAQQLLTQRDGQIINLAVEVADAKAELEVANARIAELTPEVKN